MAATNTGADSSSVNTNGMNIDLKQLSAGLMNAASHRHASLAQTSPARLASTTSGE
jgi:hypothetical protein